MSNKKDVDDMSEEEISEEFNRIWTEGGNKGKEWMEKPGRKLLLYGLGFAIAVAAIYFVDDDTLRSIRRVLRMFGL